MPPVFRFAPSPNGYLHLGHAYSALLNFDLARQAGGRFLLRIEDIDPARCRPEFETAVYEDLAWLGIGWETPVRRQSEHLADYRDAVEKLSAQGLVYPSFESRAEIAKLVAEREAHARWPRDPDGAPLYPGAAKSLSRDARAQSRVFGLGFLIAPLSYWYSKASDRKSEQLQKIDASLKQRGVTASAILANAGDIGLVRRRRNAASPVVQHEDAQDHDPRAFRHRAVDARKDLAGGFSADPGVDHPRCRAPRLQHGLKLGRKRFRRRQSVSRGSAGAKGHDLRRAATHRGEKSNRRDQDDPGDPSAHGMLPQVRDGERMAPRRLLPVRSEENPGFVPTRNLSLAGCRSCRSAKIAMPSAWRVDTGARQTRA